MPSQTLNVLDSIKESIKSIPNGQIQLLRISLMEIRPMNPLVPSADHHINERLVVQLYQNSNPANLAPWASKWNSFNNQLPQSLVSFNDQLDQFYEACLLNKIKNETVRYFYARKTTPNEFVDFEKRYKSQEEIRVSQHYANSWRRYREKLYEFERMAMHQNWSTEELNKHRKESYQKYYDFLAQSNRKFQKDSERTAHFPEFLDHQLFHGVRMTIELTFNDKISITEQLDEVIQNDWSFKNLKTKIRKLLRIYTGSIRKVRRDIISDIDQQLDSNSIH